jgi:hypothetical protein
MTMGRMRIACCIPKATNVYSQYLIIAAFTLQQWLKERASIIRYMYIACIVDCIYGILFLAHALIVASIARQGLEIIWLDFSLYFNIFVAR